MSNFPNSIDELTDGVVGQPLNNPDHTTVHNEANDAIEKIETKIGIDDSEDVNSIDYKLNNKVDKESGKGLSENDLTDELKSDYESAVVHSESSHAPSDAQKNSDILKSEIEAKLTGEIASHSHAGGGLGYTIKVQALTSSPTDGQTVYFGMLPKAPTTIANISKVYIRKAGTIKIAEIYCYSGTAGTNEAWSLYIRKNNSADTLVATLNVATSERVFSNTGLSIAVAVGDYIEIKGVQPTWTTNPATTIYGGYIYIE